MKKYNKFVIPIFVVLSVLFSYSIIMSQNTDVELVKVNANEISNNKVCWGIKRNDNNKQPTLDVNSYKMLLESKGMAMGNGDKPYVYLTFDEGYEAGYTEKILNILKDNNVKACFFITGHYLNTQTDLVKRMIEEGHIIGNHTVNHPSMPDVSNEKLKDEIMNLHIAVYEKIGYEMKYLRPPRGEFSQRTLEISKNSGYTTVMWSFAYDDWDEKKQDREDYAKNKILNNIHNGAIILLHPNSKDNANILDFCIKEIKNKGFEFKSLDEFVFDSVE